MLRFTIRFPLGVYHARSNTSPDGEPEWPPSPLRLVGALLAAAHGRPRADPEPDRALLQRLCEAPAPSVVAPQSVSVGEPITADEAVRVRGATRWGPRNYVTGALSPRNVGRDRAPVSKAGVAIGDRPISILWPDFELRDDDLGRLGRLASEVTFLGTSRSPVLVEVGTSQADEAESSGWLPYEEGDAPREAVTVRVPDAWTIGAFDRREGGRQSTASRLQSAGMVPGVVVGQEVRYAHASSLDIDASTFDPRWWGDMIVLAIDLELSEVIPKASAAYVVGRALRVALLGAYDEPGVAGEAPPILRARGAEPHCAVLPLPNVWGPQPDGRILGAALVLPSERRVADVDEQRIRVEEGLGALVANTAGERRRHLNIPGAGRVWLRSLDRRSARLATLRHQAYRDPANSWVSVTPIVHSHWRKRGADALLRQVTADCAHVGLPEPRKVEVLRGPGRDGGASLAVPSRHVPEDWRSLLNGQTDHLRISFSAPVRGPVLLGRARHFGLGLCVPDAIATGDRSSRVTT